MILLFCFNSQYTAVEYIGGFVVLLLPFEVSRTMIIGNGCELYGTNFRSAGRICFTNLSISNVPRATRLFLDDPEHDLYVDVFHAYVEHDVLITSTLGLLHFAIPYFDDKD